MDVWTQIAILERYHRFVHLGNAYIHGILGSGFIVGEEIIYLWKNNALVAELRVTLFSLLFPDFFSASSKKFALDTYFYLVYN